MALFYIRYVWKRAEDKISEAFILTQRFRFSEAGRRDS